MISSPFELGIRLLPGIITAVGESYRWEAQFLERGELFYARGDS